MKIVLPPPLTEPPPGQPFWQDFKLLLKNQLLVSWNKIRHQPKGAVIGMFVLSVMFIALLVYLGTMAYGGLKTMPPQIIQGFLSLLFMVGIAGQMFFGIPAAFAALYMSEDLELLFVTPIPHKVVFAVKSLSVLSSNLLVVIVFAFLPGVFYGLLFKAEAFFYFLVVLVGLGLWIIGTAIAELINLIIMRIVPPHRSKEAIGLIGAIAGILIALAFQIPSLVLHSQGEFNLNLWLAGQEEIIGIMNYFPWGWGSLALSKGVSGSWLPGLGWSMLLFLAGVVLFIFAFVLVERGFRRGFINLSQGEGGKRRKQRAAAREKKSRLDNNSRLFDGEIANTASPWLGMWAIAKKDLLTLKRDTREWFGYLIPLIIMVFFVGQYLLFSADSSRSSLITVLIMYIIIFSGNMALQSFGREGESEWLLNSVPLSGWSVVWGKLLASMLPTLVLMEALLVGTALAVGVSASLTIILVVAAVLLSLGSSAIGLFYSINNSRYNPDNPQQRISAGASLTMYLVNLLFLLLLTIGLVYIFPPEELITVMKNIPPVKFEGGLWSGIIYGLYLLSRPLLWPETLRIILGVFGTGLVWVLVFFGFMAGTVKQSRKGFRVELVTGGKKKL